LSRLRSRTGLGDGFSGSSGRTVRRSAQRWFAARCCIVGKLSLTFPNGKIGTSFGAAASFPSSGRSQLLLDFHHATKKGGTRRGPCLEAECAGGVRFIPVSWCDPAGRVLSWGPPRRHRPTTRKARSTVRQYATGHRRGRLSGVRHLWHAFPSLPGTGRAIAYEFGRALSNAWSRRRPRVGRFAIGVAIAAPSPVGRRGAAARDEGVWSREARNPLTPPLPHGEREPRGGR
jgi:hypothetical protein